MKQSALLMYLFIFFSLPACGQKRNIDNQTIQVDKDVEISLKPCVETNTKILGNYVAAIAFCKCFIPKFYTDFKNDPEKLKLLKDGNWDRISNEKQDYIIKYYEECISLTTSNDSTSKFTISPKMAENMKKKMKQDLAGSDIEKTNDLDKYCDCILNSLQTEFTMKEIMQPNFNETKMYQILLDKCLKTTKIY